jgi:hypothetical protein
MFTSDAISRLLRYEETLDVIDDEETLIDGFKPVTDEDEIMLAKMLLDEQEYHRHLAGLELTEKSKGNLEKLRAIKEQNFELGTKKEASELIQSVAQDIRERYMVKVGGLGVPIVASTSILHPAKTEHHNLATNFVYINSDSSTTTTKELHEDRHTADHALGIASPEYGQLADSVPRSPNIGSPREGEGLRIQEEDLIHPASGDTAGAREILKGWVTSTAVAREFSALAGKNPGIVQEIPLGIGRVDFSMELDNHNGLKDGEKAGLATPTLVDVTAIKHNQVHNELVEPLTTNV